jgi:hypothetical protein
MPAAESDLTDPVRFPRRPAGGFGPEYPAPSPKIIVLSTPGRLLLYAVFPFAALRLRVSSVQFEPSRTRPNCFSSRTLTHQAIFKQQNR